MISFLKKVDGTDKQQQFHGKICISLPSETSPVGNDGALEPRLQPWLLRFCEPNITVSTTHLVDLLLNGRYR
jgi:hypothetical protein